MNVTLVDNKVLRLKDRDIVKVQIAQNFAQGFYRSTGRNSGMEGTWLPVEGIIHYEEHPVWFVKDKYRVVDENGNRLELHRYGTQELKDVSEILGKMNIATGTEAKPSEINEWLCYGE